MYKIGLVRGCTLYKLGPQCVGVQNQSSCEWMYKIGLVRGCTMDVQNRTRAWMYIVQNRTPMRGCTKPEFMRVDVQSRTRACVLMYKICACKQGFFACGIHNYTSTDSSQTRNTFGHNAWSSPTAISGQ